MRPASRPPYSSSSAGRDAAAGLCSGPPADGRCALTPGRAAGLGLAVALGRAGACRLAAAAVVRLAVVADLAAGRAVRDRPEADDDLDEVDEALAVLDLDPPAVVREVAADLAAGWAGVGLADDIALAASVSDLLAVVMALVAAFIAAMAVDIVLADEVALVAAAVILVAAAVTLVAADETVRAAVAGVCVALAADALRAEVPDALRDVPRDVALRAVLAAVERVCVAGRLAERRDVLLLVDLVRAPPERVLRVAVRVVVRAGTDLPPVLINYGVLFHTSQRFTHPMGVSPAEQWPQADRKPPLVPAFREQRKPRRTGERAGLQSLNRLWQCVRQASGGGIAWAASRRRRRRARSILAAT